MNTTAAPPDTASTRVAEHFNGPDLRRRREVLLLVVQHNGRVSERHESHRFLAMKLAAHIDHLTDTGATYRERVIARTALEHVLNDHDLGSSLAAWPEPRALVEIVLAEAYGVANVSTQWPDL